MRYALRFLFSTADAALIDRETIVVQDTPYATKPAANAPYPQSMNITFSLASGGTVAPQVRPLFPGVMTFLANADAPGELPTPRDVADTNYADWKTRGTLMVAIRKPSDLAAFRDQFGIVEVVPTIVWYSGIVLTKKFLLETLVKHLHKDLIYVGSNGGVMCPGNEDWENHAISGFLKGKYRPKLSLRATPAEDDVTKPMPIVADTGNGKFRLIVSCATRGRPQDARQSELEDLETSLDHENPAHPVNGAIPARYVYRMAKKKMIEGSNQNSAANKILADWPNAPRYFAIRCTRTWQRKENVSVHFPQQQIKVKRHQAQKLLAHQRLPVHGVFYLAQNESTTQPPKMPQVDVSFDGNMRWIDGNRDHVWRYNAASNPLNIDFSVLDGDPAHIQLRLPMGEAIMKEPFDAPGGTICTYLSMRRSLRALIDNRIAGGRLNFRRDRTSRVTSALIDDAWSATGSALSSSVVAKNRPSIFVTETTANALAREKLLPIWEVFFPGSARKEAAEANESAEYTLGQVAYEIWQSNPDPARESDTRNNYPQNVVGRGAPGALVVSGLASCYAVDGLKQSGESDDSYLNRVANEMMTKPKAGAVLQFWNKHTDFKALRKRKAGVESYGHSPIFRQKFDNQPEIQIIDQDGIRYCKKIETEGNRSLIEWKGSAQEIWVAANWDE